MDGADTRVLIVGEDPLARGGLTVLLAAEPGLTVLGQAAPGAQTEAAVATLQPEAVLWDLGASPNTVPAQLSAVPAVVALVTDGELAAEALATGARGALSREAGAARIAAALRAAAHGLVTFDEGFSSAVLRPQAPASGSLIEPLTPREIEVLQLLSEGLSNRVIGDRLGISEHTAKFHVNAILGKLGAQGRTDAVVRAARLGLILL